MMQIESKTGPDACGIPVNPGDDVMRRIGALDEAVERLEDEERSEEVDTEKVGNWITIIGRAILAIFKP